MLTANRIQFFLGSNTGAGFRSYFNELLGPDADCRLFILKGGPGTGKSSLMKKIAAALEARGDTVTYVHCASDPGSLDAVIDPEARIAVADGTSPHTLDPRCPGAAELIFNAGDGWDAGKLVANKKEIALLSNAISIRHGRATSCIKAADALLENNRRVAEGYVDRAAVSEFVWDFFHGLEREGVGREKTRLLSAVSVGETVFFENTLHLLSRKIYAITDEYGAAAHLLIGELRRAALSLGVNVVACPCSVSAEPKLEHLILPAFGTSFTSVNSFHGDAAGKAELPSFMRPIPARADESRMRAHLETARMLIAEAASEVADAKLLHDELEAYYVRAMDFSCLDRIRERILSSAGL